MRLISNMRLLTRVYDRIQNGGSFEEQRRIGGKNRGELQSYSRCSHLSREHKASPSLCMLRYKFFLSPMLSMLGW